MSNFRIPLVFALFLFAAPVEIGAVCGGVWPDRTQVLEIRIDSCQSPASFAADAAGCISPKWLSRMQQDAVRDTEGWVVRGTVQQIQELTTYQDGTMIVDAPTEANVPGVWFVPASSNGAYAFSCPSTPDQVVQFVVSSPCCDVIPPTDFSCWFELRNIRPVSEKLKAKLGHR